MVGLTDHYQPRRGGAKRRGGVDQEIDFLEPTARRFAAPRLDQGGEFARSDFVCKSEFPIK